MEKFLRLLHSDIWFIPKKKKKFLYLHKKTQFLTFGTFKQINVGPNFSYIWAKMSEKCSLLNFRLYVYVQELFVCIVEKILHCEKFFNPIYVLRFVTEHHINLSPVLNLLFNSCMCCQLLVLWRQNLLRICTLEGYLCAN